MENNVMSPFEDYLFYKYELISYLFSKERRKEILHSYESNITDWEKFFKFVSYLIQNEKEFLLYDTRLLNSVYTIINLHRFENKQNADLVNDTITELRPIQSIAGTKAVEDLKQKYTMFNQYFHSSSFKDKDSLLFALVHDFEVYKSLKSGDMDLIAADKRFIASMNYLLYFTPQFFEGDAYLNAMLKLSEFDFSSFPEKKNKVHRLERKLKRIKFPK